VRFIEKDIKRLIAFYESRRLSDPSLEPTWTPEPYACLYRWRAGERGPEIREEVEEAIGSLSLQGEYDDPFFGKRFIEDGCKVGTASWVFIGRNLPDSTVAPRPEGIVVVGRPVVPATVEAMIRAGCRRPRPVSWIAYSLKVPIHLQVAGPCESYEQAVEQIPVKLGPRPPNELFKGNVGGFHVRIVRGGNT
jgi:hypothetical protein